MEDIARVVQETVEACREKGKSVSDTLAAFVSRAVIYDNPERFQLDKELTDADVGDLISMCVDRMIQKDSPSLETITMQVAFDEAYVRAEEKMQQDQALRAAKLSDLETSIVSVRTKAGGGDFESLTRIYRQIFAYLMVRVGAESSGDRNVESEIAAALESVFPRIGLKSFILMTAEEKVAQLQELASIVLGIRLFNREIGRGGAGLRDLALSSYDQVSRFNERLQKDLGEVAELCQGYTDVLLYCHSAEFKEEQREEAEDGGGRPPVEESTIRRWQDEMTNRRQYLAYLQSLQEDGLMSQQKVHAAREAFVREMSDLKALVGARTSVPKEQVYPKFDVLARYYLSLGDELKVVDAREQTLRVLHGFRNSYETTLSLDWIQRARSARRGSAAAGTAGAGEVGGVGGDGSGEGGEGGGASAPMEGKSTGGAGEEGKTGGGGEATLGEEGKGGDGIEGKAGGGATTVYSGGEGKSTGEGDGGGDDEIPARLSVESTPEFMQLPLEYQGYCPWTIVNRGGLLLPGNPSLGVLRYKNTFNVFVSEEALQDFTADPRRYIRGVVRAARKAPELIHLLRLQEHFPQASLTYLMRGLRAGAGAGGVTHPLLAPGARETRDAATETPTHFVEKHIDPSYDWNEVANLRKCKTHGSQTDSSHFRREATSQVYLPRAKGTQTRKEAGTNPPRNLTYFAGLRSKPGSLEPASKVVVPSKHATGELGRAPAVLNLQFEL